MTTKLELRRADDALREPVAWFLPGADVADWLAEVASWPVALERIRFYLVARGGDREPWKPEGALAVPEIKLSSPPTGGRAQPYGVAGNGRLYLPVDAFVWPPLDEGEIAASARHPVLVFHPAAGLCGFEIADARFAWEFLAPPPHVAEAWDAATGTIPLNEHLRAVRLADPLLPEEIFGEESGDIGSRASEILEPDPHEPRSPLAKKLLLGTMGAAAQALLAATKFVPHTAAAPTWINALEKWASQHLTGARDQLEKLRHKELHRLLERLRSDPERGLQHALPLSAFAHRGRSTGSTQLGRRNLDFNLGRLGGGQVADFWDVPPDLQRELANRYREAAQRELKLGRHRRAACIFAELLGDLASAADALKQGRHFREAALLYETKLHQPLAAAACLAEAGLIPEAIAIYEKHARWLEIADLYDRLGARDEARTAVRREVDAKRAAGDILAAAKLLETRLQEPDVALELLASAWPDGQQALACLQERFALLDRLHRPSEMQELVRVLARQRTPATSAAGVIGVLTKVAETAVIAHVRDAAADAVRMKAASALMDRAVSGADEISVLRALTRLAPHDRLLARDTVRFRESRPAAPPPRPAPRWTGGKITLQPGEGLCLPKIGKWHRVIADQHAAYAVATTPKDKVFFSRIAWRGAIQSADWPDPAAQLRTAFVMAQHAETIVLARPFAAALPLQTLPHMDVFGGTGCVAGTPTWLPLDVVQATSARGTLWVVRAVDSRIVLASYANERLAWTQDITDELTSAGATGGGTALTLDARGKQGAVALGYGSHLITVEGGKVAAYDLGSRVMELIPAPEAIGGWVALLETGAAYLPWTDKQVQSLESSMAFPRGILLGDGRLVVISGSEGRVWTTIPKGFAPSGTFAVPSDPFVAITATNERNEFALWHEGGAVKRWRLP